MQKTEWRTLFNPSKDIRALQISHWEAIDIGYECPKVRLHREHQFGCFPTNLWYMLTNVVINQCYLNRKQEVKKNESSSIWQNKHRLTERNICN